uniref:Uncharacterized protein n=1 Tax=Anguilla anguilla TaxID=7936 RepID=A0A0E9S6P1_ANGAN
MLVIWREGTVCLTGTSLLHAAIQCWPATLCIYYSALPTVINVSL